MYDPNVWVVRGTSRVAVLRLLDDLTCDLNAAFAVVVSTSESEEQPRTDGFWYGRMRVWQATTVG
jgi:hypothetical protein